MCSSGSSFWYLQVVSKLDAKRASDGTEPGSDAGQDIVVPVSASYTRNRYSWDWQEGKGCPVKINRHLLAFKKVDLQQKAPAWLRVMSMKRLAKRLIL
ncbi:hypothetical protein WJX77_010380 [Trebouxia sp. C0004]